MWLLIRNTFKPCTFSSLISLSVHVPFSLSLFRPPVSGYNLHWLWLFRVHWLQISRVAINPSEEDGVRVMGFCSGSTAHGEGSPESVSVDEETRDASKSEKVESLIPPHHHSSKRRTRTEEQLSTKSVWGVSECQCLPLESMSLSFVIHFHFCKAWGIT